MKMHQVRYFLALCRELNFTRAARCCAVAQPSLTNAVKRLERELGGALFERGSDGTRLTAFGKLLRPQFERLDRCAGSIRRDAQRFHALARRRRAPGDLAAARLPVVKGRSPIAGRRLS